MKKTLLPIALLTAGSANAMTSGRYEQHLAADDEFNGRAMTGQVRFSIKKAEYSTAK